VKWRGDIIRTTLTQNSLYNQSDGIMRKCYQSCNSGLTISEIGPITKFEETDEWRVSGYKILTQGLGTIYNQSRSEEEEDVCGFLRAYFGVQVVHKQYYSALPLTFSKFNAILSNAANGDVYGGSWAERQPSGYNRDNQVAAMFGLINAARTIPQEFPQPHESQDPQPHAPQDSPNAPKTRILVGPVVGGVLGGLVLASLCFWIVRRRRQVRKAISRERTTVEPFVENEGRPMGLQSSRKHHEPIVTTSHQSRPSFTHSSGDRGDREVNEIVQLVAERMQAMQGRYASLPPPAYSSTSIPGSNNRWTPNRYLSSLLINLDYLLKQMLVYNAFIVQW
jgi:hypothetical protein